MTLSRRTRHVQNTVFCDVTPYSLLHRHVSGEPAASIFRKEEWKKIFELWSTHPIVTRRIEWKYNHRQLTSHLSQMFNVTVHLSASQDHISCVHLYKDSGKFFYILCYNNCLNILWIQITEDSLARPKHAVQSDIKWPPKLSYWGFFHFPFVETNIPFNVLPTICSSISLQYTRFITQYKPTKFQNSKC